MSDLREMLHDAHGSEYNPVPDYESAKNDPHGCVIIEGDYGGQVYLSCPMKYVKCSHEMLLQLGRDLDKKLWGDEAGSDVYYESYEPPHEIAGGMGGGLLIDGLWVHDEIEQLGLKEKILAVLNATVKRINH